MRPAELDQDLKTLLGNEPFPWQRRLLQAFLQGRFPSSCDIPTGLGKTSVIALWLRVAVDATNPGHFFAACGLLELAAAT